MLRKFKVLLLNFDEIIGPALQDWLNSLGDIEAFDQKEILPENFTPDLIILFRAENIDRPFDLREYIDIPHIIIGNGQKLANEIDAAYVNLPIRFTSLEAKIRQILRLEVEKQMSALKLGDYIFNPTKKALILENNAEIKLTEKEISILTYLNQAAGSSVGREELLREVWRYNEGVTTHTLETHIYRLRQKLAETFGNREIIVTTDGGYSLQT